MTARRLALAAAVLATAALAGTTGALTGPAQAAHGVTTVRVGLVTDIGGLNDRSFNYLANKGAQTAKRYYGIDLRVLTSKSNADYIPNLSSLARQGYDLVIGVGFLMADAMNTVALKFPKTSFAIIDVAASTMKGHPKNVRGLLFKEQEAGYLVGYAAGLWLKTHPVQGHMVAASVGGQKIPPVDRYIAGYQYGVKKADPRAELLNGYSQDFVAQDKCKEAALNQIANNAGVVFQVAGQCGLGALDAAKEKGVMGIGVDADQHYLGAHILTSALKKVDVAVLSTISAEVQAKKAGTPFRGGFDAVFTAKNGGIGFGAWSAKVGTALRKAANSQLIQLKLGKIRGIPATVK
ncbi:MAG: BMP family ABC transporter substrate-binding protein [Gaiellaceae bacterium]